MSFVLEFLCDVLLDGVLDALVPESARTRSALLILFNVFSLVFVAVVSALLWFLPDPLNEPSWGFNLIVCSIVYGSGGVLASLGCLATARTDRLAASISLLTHSLAVAIPIICISF
jgi:hypothetical protein